MFEHSLYEPEPVAEPLHEGDLFYQHELPSWKLGPRIYKILGISAVANLVAFAIFTTTPILTMKGCDSPLVSGVCQALDTLYIGSTVFGSDREYVDAVYDKTKIGDADITFVDVTSDTPPLDYPEGYFAIANPQEYAELQALANDPNAATSGTIPGIPPGITMTTPSQGRSIFDTPQHLPKQNPKTVEGDLPSGFGGSTVASNGGKHGPKNGGQTAQPTPSPSPTQPITTESVQAVQINKLPLTDLADLVNKKLQKKEVDLSKNFTVTLYGVLAQDGTLDTAKSKFDKTKEQGDPAMIAVGEASMQALGMTGFLKYLKDPNIGIDRFTATITQDDQNITVVISAPAPTSERAQRMASGMNGVISIGKLTAGNPSPERQLLDGAQATTDGKKTFVLNFTMPKQVAQEMINKALQDAQAKKQATPQPSSGGFPNPNSNAALR